MSKVSDAANALSISECISLLYIATTPVENEVPWHHVRKLLLWGLVRRSEGRLVHTDFGQQVADWTAEWADAAGAA